MVGAVSDIRDPLLNDPSGTVPYPSASSGRIHPLFAYDDCSFVERLQAGASDRSVRSPRRRGRAARAGYLVGLPPARTSGESVLLNNLRPTRSMAAGIDAPGGRGIILPPAVLEGRPPSCGMRFVDAIELLRRREMSRSAIRRHSRPSGPGHLDQLRASPRDARPTLPFRAMCDSPLTDVR